MAKMIGRSAAGVTQSRLDTVDQMLLSNSVSKANILPEHHHTSSAAIDAIKKKNSRIIIGETSSHRKTQSQSDIQAMRLLNKINQ